MNNMRTRRVLVNGANGILGRLIFDKLPPGVAVAGTRRTVPHYSNQLLISSTGEIHPKFLENIDTVVNCAGRVEGPKDELWSSNVRHPLKLAAAAKSAGVKQFIQVSSFSIFGKVEFISSKTPINPSGNYGESKALVEEKLLELRSSDFNIFTLRLPFMFGVQNTSLMEKLIRVLSCVPVFPISKCEVQRSMLTYVDAANLLIRASDEGLGGVASAADHQLFSFELLAKTMLEENFGLFPSIGDRIFASSILELDNNWARPVDLQIGLNTEIRNLLRQRFYN
jgi:nucleoside-diphosphate-sugar epimerase